MGKRKVEKKEVTQKVDNAQDNYVNEQLKRVSNEAIEALNLIGEVLEAIDKQDKEKAIEACEKSLGKIEVLLARDPNLSQVPVDIREQVIDYPGTVDDIVHTKEVLKELIEDDELQAARDIMLNLASELDIFITLLPVGAYPAAIKGIIPLIEAGDFQEAKKLLIEILDTLVLEKIVIPLPVLRAQKAIERASDLTKGKDDANKEELKELLEYAKEQLLLAQALGYGKVKEDYKDLLDEIEKIESILADKDKGTKDIFEELKEKLNKYMATFNKIHKAKEMPKAEEK
ncbi:MAG: YfdX family protein [Epsilonproteobacteria bacterium]|nr:YfdX family protein [Campylobacterota bacterium]